MRLKPQSANETGEELARSIREVSQWLLKVT
jgi:hypothetical protein